MKRFVCLLMTLIMVLGLFPTAALAAGNEGETQTLPESIGADTVWSYLDDGTDPAGNSAGEDYNRTSWTAEDFDDSEWSKAAGSFGAKNGGEFPGATVQLNGCPGTADNISTYYFRTKVNVEDASAVTKITGTIAYDDAAIVYINGVKAIAFNEAGITGNNSYCTNKANTTETFEITDAAVLSKLVDGENVVAVELHNQYENSSDIWFAMPDMTFSTETPPTTNSLLNGTATWTYLDNGIDPAGDSVDRTVWTGETFETTEAWKNAAGSFGAKYGAISDLGSGYIPNTLLTQYKKDGTTDIEAYFFRTTFTVDSLDGMTKLNGTLQYDDGVIVYINGQRVAAFDDNACDASGNSLNKGFDENLQYGGSNAGTPKTVSFELLDLSILHTGTNTIAVELHQGRATSSDVWFHLTDLSLSDEEVEYQSNISLSMGEDESRMNFTWYSPLADAKLLVADNKGMNNSQTFGATASVANDGQYSCKATVTGLVADTTYYYQLSNKNNKSDVYSFRTDDGGAFSFAFVGDPQIGASNNTASDAAGWENTLNIIDNNDVFSDVSFLLSAGDQVNTASDENQYDGYLDHDVLTSLPVATAIGNHDSGSNTYSQHFNVPNEASADYGKTAAGGDYYFVYNNVLFMVLNSNAQSADDVNAHKAFMQAAIKATENDGIQWKIVMFHHTLFTVASHAKDSYITDTNGFKAQIIPVLKDLDVDVVLQGHDHVYCRTYMMDGTTPITQSEKYEYDNSTEQAPTAVNDPTGILYVTANSGSGSKTYPIRNETFDFSAVQNQDNKANVSKVTVSDKQFTITTYRTSNMAVVDSFTIKRDGGDAEPAKLLIDQVYGDGGKNETPIANSFIELYNPNDEAVSLDGYALTYGDKTLTLDASKSIPAKGSYLILGAAADTSADFQTYNLPAADQDCDWTIDNKKYTITLTCGSTEVDSVTADEDVSAVKVSKQKSLRRIDHADTDTNDDFRIVVWEKGKMTATAETLSQYAPHNSKGEYGSLVTTGTEDTVTINTKSDTGLVEYLSSYSTGNTDADGGVAEIVKFNEENDCIYLVSGQTQTLDIVKVKEDGSTELVKKIDIAALGSANGFSAGDITSVDVNTDRDLVVIAVQHAAYTKNGAIVLLDYEGSFVAKYETGVQPDMVTFTPDGSKILTANEGEPREGYEATDPMGSVTVVELDSKVVNTYNFASLDSSRDALINDGVLLKTNTDPSVDLEPEFIAVSEDNKTAYVTLQENNAIGALDLTTGTWKYVKGLGFKDYSAEGNGLDLDVDDKIDIRNENVYGVYMPDGISVVTIGGQDYLITANEGDAREWGDYENIDSAKLILADDQEAGKKIEYLDTSKTDGLESGKTYVLGGRSFSIWKADTLEQVFDSGDDFETITAEEFPAYFNSGHDEAGLDKRSHKKGVEPESVSVLETNGKTYAVIGLERMGGIMVYDITNPTKSTYADYLNVRGFSETVTDLSKLGDLGPEGICAISAENSPTGNAMILVANEVSGTVTVAQIEKTSTSGGSSSGGGSSSSSYAVTLNQEDNGTVTASSKTAAKGSTVTLTVKADSGYELNALTVTDKNGSEVTLTKKSDGVYTFTMPASKVTVSVSFTQTENPVTGLPFTDVKSGDWFYDGVRFAYEEGIMNGLSDDTFGPSVSTTRGMVVTMLWRMENEPQAKTGAAFADVKESAYYAEAVAWAAENGIVNGVSETAFSPDQEITREQLAVMLYRYSQIKGYDLTVQGDLSGFGDGKQVSGYAVASMQWAVGASLIQGTDSGLVPAGSATRAQLATILYRFLTNFAS